jgi:carboxyl-terminal processing protease
VIKEPVQFPSVLIDSIGTIPVVSLFVFADSTVSGHSTATEFRDALNDIRQYPVFVLDLRQDPGGSLSQSLQVADEMLGADTLIIRQEQRFFNEKYRVPLFGAQDQKATSKGVATNRKVVLLADSGTASAAEILIASLRDNLKAPLVGTRTYGKGIGQIVLTTPGGGLALITHLHFRAPKGEDYHGKGMSPDYPVSGSGTEFLSKAVEVARNLAGQSPLAKRGVEAKKWRQDAERIQANRAEHRFLSAGAVEFK